MPRLALAVAAAIVIHLMPSLTPPAAAVGGDVAKSHDYPGIGRFKGSVITGYDVKDFDAAILQAAPFKDGKAADRAEWKAVSPVSPTARGLVPRSLKYPAISRAHWRTPGSRRCSHAMSTPAAEFPFRGDRRAAERPCAKPPGRTGAAVEPSRL